jgi:8-oxo-dGTP pyrophosphatase MutT (NUDIX family)
MDHDEEPTWRTPTPLDQRAYGGVLINDAGKVLLREPTNHYDGYVWTFPKGRGLDPVETALREVVEETGYIGSITCPIPGGYKGGTSETFYFLMRAVGFDAVQMDDETSDLRWVTYEEAQAMIELSPNVIGRQRDLRVLDAAFAAWRLQP